jgi:hypothetical protein
VREARRDRLRDPREAQEIRVAEHRLDRGEMTLAERLEADRHVRRRYAGSSADGSDTPSTGAVGSVAVVSAGGVGSAAGGSAGAGAVSAAGAASAGVLAGESSEPPKSFFSQLNMRAMLQGRSSLRGMKQLWAPWRLE